MHRLARPEDLVAIHAIYMHEDVIPFLGHDPMPIQDFDKILAKLIAGQSFFVVEVGGQIQGFYKAVKHEGRAAHVAYLGTLAVAPAARGTGLAAKMIEHAVARLQAEGITRVELTLESDNPRALKFYRKLGFEFEGIMRAAYKRGHEAHYTDEYFMAKLLPPPHTR